MLFCELVYKEGPSFLAVVRMFGATVKERGSRPPYGPWSGVLSCHFLKMRAKNSTTPDNKEVSSSPLTFFFHVCFILQPDYCLLPIVSHVSSSLTGVLAIISHLSHSRLSADIIGSAVTPSSLHHL